MIIGITGRIGAGKGVVLELLKKNGFEYTKISKALYEEADKRGVPRERKALQDLGNELRMKEGGGALAKRLIVSLDKDVDYIVDSIRNPLEVVELKRYKNFFLISVDAPQKIRFDRVIKRAKDIDPKTWEEFVELDNRDFCEKDEKGNIVELGQQVGRCMELADFKLVNAGSFDSFQKKILELIEEIKRIIN